MLKTLLSNAVALTAFFICQAPALAADLVTKPPVAPAQVIEDRWNFNITPYFWMAGLGGQTKAGDDINMPFNQVIENLSFALMTSIAAEKGRFGVYSDLIYMNLEGSKTTSTKIIRRTFNAKLDATIQGFITTNALGYKIVDTPGTKIAGLGGFRYLWLSTDLDFSLGNFSASASDQGQVIDAIVGLRGESKLADRWSVAYYGDIGTGQSDVTWQLFGALGYEIKNVDLFAGYRYIGWRFDDVGGLDALDVHGPVLGARFKF